MQRRWTIELAIMVFEELRILAKRWGCRSPEFWGFWLFGDISRRCTDMVSHHPRLKMYIHWGTGPKKVYILGPFGRDCIPHPASYILNFWWPPPTSYIFNLLYEMRGDLPLYIMFGEASKSPQKVARQKNRQISNPVPFIHFELPGRLSGGPTEYYQILHDSHDCKNRALDRALWCSPSCKNRALACESCYRQWARHNIYIYIFTINYMYLCTCECFAIIGLHSLACIHSS